MVDRRKIEEVRNKGREVRRELKERGKDGSGEVLETEW